MRLSPKAAEDIQAKLSALKQKYGSLRSIKADDAYREAYPDAVDLHEFRQAFTKAAHAEKKEAKGSAGAAESGGTADAVTTPTK